MTELSQDKRQTELTLSQLIAYKQPELYYDYNDRGMSSLFSDVYKDKARYNVTAREWYTYNGVVWEVDTGSMKVKQLAKELTDELTSYALCISDDHRKAEFLKVLAHYGQLKYRKTMLEDAQDENFIEQADLDRDKNLFNCLNGTYNLATGEFMPHEAADLLSKVSNVIYDREAVNSPLFEKFIEEIMQDNEEKITYLQKLFGLSLTADTSLETCWILYGASTRNGKSCLIETISYMMGDYARSTQPQTLAQKQNKDTRTASGDIARLAGCRFLSASEPPKRMLFDVALLKTLLGRDAIIARNLYEREFQFYPEFKLFITTNFLPLVTDDSVFASGRVNVITFDRHFSEAEQDKHLKDKLRQPEVISAIFNWCLIGLNLFRQSGAEPPQSVRAATEEYRQSSDKIGNFISECLVKTGNNTKAGTIYERYSEWCSENGFGCENKGNFFDELKNKGIFAKSGTVKGQSFQNVVKGYEISDYVEYDRRQYPTEEVAKIDTELPL